MHVYVEVSGILDNKYQVSILAVKCDIGCKM